MRPQSGQLALFEFDAGDSPGQAREDPAPSPPAPLTSATMPPNEAAAAPDPLALLTGLLGQLAQKPLQPATPDLQQARDEWLRRLQAARRSESALAAYRIAIDDLLAWCGDRDRSVFEEATIVDYLAAYQQRARPAPATYYRRFGLLRRFLRWLSRRSGLPDPFLELESPPKPQQEADWLTEHEFARLLAAAAHPLGRRAGLAERDRLVLLALVQTGLRRCRADRARLGRPRTRRAAAVTARPPRQGRQAAPPAARTAQLAHELALLRAERQAPARTRRSSAASRASGCSRRSSPRSSAAPPSAPRLEKRVTAHTLRHTAATWLRQQTGDARLVAAYLGHADLSTVSRYAHVADDELHEAAAALAAQPSATAGAASLDPAGRDDAGTARATGRPRRAVPQKPPNGCLTETLTSSAQHDLHRKSPVSRAFSVAGL